MRDLTPLLPSSVHVSLHMRLFESLDISVYVLNLPAFEGFGFQSVALLHPSTLTSTSHLLAFSISPLILRVDIPLRHHNCSIRSRQVLT